MSNLFGRFLYSLLSLKNLRRETKGNGGSREEDVDQAVPCENCRDTDIQPADRRVSRGGITTEGKIGGIFNSIRCPRSPDANASYVPDVARGGSREGAETEGVGRSVDAR